MVCSSGEDNPSFAFMNSSHSSHSYGVFLWNGVRADPVVKATALTKATISQQHQKLSCMQAFALERRLIEEQGCIHQTHNGGGTSLQAALMKRAGSGVRGSKGKATPVQPTATECVVAVDQQQLASTNELFHWLIEVTPIE